MSIPQDPDNPLALNPKDFAKFLMAHTPLANETFNFLVWWGKPNMFINLAIAPLYATMITQPVVIDTQLGTHRFNAVVDRPVWLVTQDNPECVNYGVDGEELSIGVRENGSVVTVTWFRKFEPEIIEHSGYKIVAGELYKKIGAQWLPVKLN